MFTKIERVQVDQITSSTSNEIQQQSSQQNMTLGQSSKDIFLPVLPKIGSPSDSMLLNNYKEDLTPTSPDEIDFMDPNITSRGIGKKVRFSQPLEFWKEFDRDSGYLLDENGNQEELVQKTEEYHIEQTKINYEAKVTKKLNECREKRRGRAKFARTITESVEKLKLEDEKTSVRKFIAHYKRSTARDYSLQNKPTRKGIVSGTIAADVNVDKPAENIITESYQAENVGNTLSNLSGKNPALNLKDINSCSCNTTWSQRQKQRSCSLPSLHSKDRKLFEERLLPGTHDEKCTSKGRVKYSCYGSEFRGGISIAQLTQTPLIVQLFE